MKNGPYVLVKAPKEYPGKKYRGRYVYEHHLVWWDNTKEILKDDEILHHINDDKHDNSFCNLEKMTRSQHTKLHAKPKTMMTAICSWCGNEFEGVRYKLLGRIKRNPNGKVFCGRSCQVKEQQYNRYNAK